MSRTGIALLCAALAAAAAAPAPAAARRYRGVALGNSSQGTPIPKHHFVVGDGYTLRLRDAAGARTPYRVCLAWHGRDQYCARGRTGRRLSPGWSQGVNHATAPNAGSGYVYRWYVAGTLVARWHVTVGRGDRRRAAHVSRWTT